MNLKDALLAFVLSAVPGAAAAQVEALEPTAKWVIDFAPAQCVATRAYGSKENPLYLMLKSPAIGDLMQVSIVRKGGDVEPDQVAATIEIDGRPRRINMLTFSPKETDLRSNVVNLPAAEFAQLATARTFRTRWGGFDRTFRLSNMPELLKVMATCQRDLQEVWNVAPEGSESKLPTRAHANLARIFGSYDYPAVSISKDDTGAVVFVILIDETGKVADCTVVETSGAAALDAQTCAIVRQRAKFKPALNRDGKPAKDAYRARIRWQIRA